MRGWVCGQMRNAMQPTRKCLLLYLYLPSAVVQQLVVLLLNIWPHCCWSGAITTEQTAQLSTERTPG